MYQVLILWRTIPNPLPCRLRSQSFNTKSPGILWRNSRPRSSNALQTKIQTPMDRRSSHSQNNALVAQGSSSGNSRIIIAGRWEIFRRLGYGAHGVIYEGKDLSTQQAVVVKAGRGNSGNASVVNEGIVYRALRTRYGNLSGILKFHYSGTYSTSSALVLEKVGQSVSDSMREYLHRHHRCFSVKRAMKIGIQVVKLLQKVHAAGYLHGDVKPNNILFGAEQSSKVYLIDFGASKKYIDDAGNHITDASPRASFIFTEYAALSLLFGAVPSRRDDLESLGYCLVFLCNGHLPWSRGATGKKGARLFMYLRHAVSNCSTSTLCDGMGSAVQQYFDYLRGLSPTADPDYSYLLNRLTSASEG